jgi:SAM-dependent methyltransferase
MKLFYQIGYKYFQMPWDIGPRQELVELVESGRIKPCRAIDLGSGTASNALFLAQHGFDVTGVDFAASAIELGQKRARHARVKAEFVKDDLTNLQHVDGVFDFLVDYGTLDDLRPGDRDLYLNNVLSLTHHGSLFLLYCFEWSPSWWERLLLRVAFFGAVALKPGEVKQRFSQYFKIEEIARAINQRGWPRGWAVYLMTRKDK